MTTEPNGWRRFWSASGGALAALMLATVVPLFTAPEAHAGGVENAAAPSADLKKVLGKIQEHYDGTNTFAARFDESLTRPGASERRRSGTIYFAKPGKLRWEFAPPDSELIVSDGTTLYTYDPGLNQVIETPLAHALRSPGVSAFLLGMGKLERDFDASMPAERVDGDRIGVTLEPRSGGDVIGLEVDSKTYDITALTLTDQLGNRTLLRFSQIRNNIEIDGKRFEFAVPEGADIVRPQETPVAQW
jgi:outer membrane lipoprotein-sorting protein